MNRLAVLLFLLAGATAGHAQTILLKNGTVVPADGLARQNDMVMTTVKTPSGGVGQIGYYASDISKLNLPEPAAMATASSEVAKGEFSQALADILPVVADQKMFQDIPGNWWAKAALVEVSALCGLKRNDDARALAGEITTSSHDPDILAAVKLEVTMITTFKNPQEALAAYDALINQSADPQSLSEAWIAEGNIYLAQHQFDDALLAYLTVTVLYPDDNPLVPQALWGSGQAYAKLKDPANATSTYQNLVDHYPDTPEASLAKAELMKKEKKT